MDRKLTDIEGDDRTIVNLLVDQIEFANVILLNKSDLVTKEHTGILEQPYKNLTQVQILLRPPTQKLSPLKF